jgi:hypothetical protein
MTNSFSSISFNREGIFLNYSKVEDLYNKKYNLSPRKYTCGSSIGSDLFNPSIKNRNDLSEMEKWKQQFVDGLPTRE